MLLSNKGFQGDFCIMIGRDENQEEVTFKVADRRKFNPDGTLKEGVRLEESLAAAEAEQTAGKPAEAVSNPAPAAREETERPRAAENDEDDLPGADDPASFVNFLSTLATNAAAALGAVPHPATGRRTVDLETGKYWLDVLGMLRDKTQGNLHVQEKRLLEDLLADLRMQYVAMARATEEKLKAQAAQKFSSSDILGRKG
jgi:hypothetical protein